MYNLFPCSTKITIFHISSVCSTVKKKKLKWNFCLCHYESWSRISCLVLFILTSGAPCSIFYCYSAVFCALVAACIDLSGKRLSYSSALSFFSFYRRYSKWTTELWHSHSYFNQTFVNSTLLAREVASVLYAEGNSINSG